MSGAAPSAAELARLVRSRRHAVVWPPAESPVKIGHIPASPAAAHAGGWDAILQTAYQVLESLNLNTERRQIKF